MKNSKNNWIIGELDTPIGKIPRVASELTRQDIFGSWKARWSKFRKTYQVDPGIYAIGDPNQESPLVVSANYKMSFDRLRSELSGRNLWILVIDTRGINVWCAAGKGTFSDQEITEKLKDYQVDNLVNHKKIILPQLSAPGVSSDQLKKSSGFRAVFGPVKAADLPTFLDNNLIATPKMRKVEFPLKDRLILTPIEIIPVLKYSIYFIGVAILLNLFPLDKIFVNSLRDWTLFLVMIFTGSVITPVLLPLLPSRSLAVKGWITGIGTVLIFSNFLPYSSMKLMGNLLIFPLFSSFLALNFTGATTYTSLSGVIKEMRLTLPLYITALLGGLTLIIINMF